MWDWLKTRQTKQGSYSAAYVVVFIAILAAVNYLGDKYNQTYDATSNKLHSLSDQTLKILGNLERDVTIYYFDRKLEFPRAEELLVKYANASDRVEVQYVDPDSKPEMARAMNVRSYGSTYVEYGIDRQEAQTLEEESVTNAIIQAIKGEEKTACFVTGHGEADTADTERDGLAAAKEQTEGANYSTQTVSLLQSGELPEECTVVVVAGPEKEFLDAELEILKGYVEQGGRMLLMLDQGASPEWVEVLSGWGIKVNDDVVVDFNPLSQLFGGSPLAPVVNEYHSHPISNVMTNVASVFPLTRTVEGGGSVTGWSVDELFSTAPSSFATVDLKVEDGEVVRNADNETEGPVNLAVAATYDVPLADSGAQDESPGEGDGPESEPASEDGEAGIEQTREARLVVVGTSLFARNNFIGMSGNADLYLNMLNWLTSDEDLISIRPKDPEETPLDLTMADMGRLFWVTVVLFPLVIIVAGVRVWWLRR